MRFATTLSLLFSRVTHDALSEMNVISLSLSPFLARISFCSNCLKRETSELLTMRLPVNSFKIPTVVMPRSVSSS